MKRFKVKITKRIIVGSVEETHIVEALTKFDAEDVVKNDDCTYCVDADYSVKHSEQIGIETEEL